MDDQLDKDLSKRIKEVFDNFEDTSENEGWLKLREKFPVERNRRGLVWLWTAAALFLLFLGIGLLKLFNVQKPDNHIAHSKPVKSNPYAQSTEKDTNIGGNSISAQSTHAEGRSIKDTSGSAKTHALISANPASKTQSIIVNSGVSAHNVVSTSPNTSRPVNTSPKKNNQPSQPNVLPSGIHTNKTSPLLAHVDTAKKQSIATNNTSQQVAVTSKPNAPPKDTSASKSTLAAKKPNIDALFAADQNKKPEKALKAYSIKFGVFATSYVSYAKNGTNQVNGGGGFTVGIPLGKRLSLVTGASVNQNAFNYNNQVLFTASPAAFVPRAYANIAFSSATTTSFAHSADLLSIDVPINLQYQLNTHRYPVYLLGGLGSGTFVNESYGYIYANGSTQPTQTYKGLNDFYFARTLNLGFGVGYPVGKSQIIVEPFVKYPLYGMGAEQLKFGASGINLKFNFPTKK